MAGAQKTRGVLEVSYGGKDAVRIDVAGGTLGKVDPPGTAAALHALKEFNYRSDVTAIGDPCEFIVVKDRTGQTIRDLRIGSLVKLKLSNPAVNGGQETLKHRGRVTHYDADELAGTLKVTVPDLGWHLQHCSAPLFKPLRGLPLNKIIDPAAGFLDPSFGFQGLRTGLDANRRNRELRLGKAGAAAAQREGQLGIINIVQTEPGDSFADVLKRYCTRENQLVNVSCDGYLQVWEPDYDRPPAYVFVNAAGDRRNNVINIRRIDDGGTRYSEVKCVGEITNPGLAKLDKRDVNATKTRGTFPRRGSGQEPLVPYVHRLTFGEGEMFTDELAAKMAEWKWKMGVYDSHYLEVTVADHFQLDERGRGAWYESDQMCKVHAPGLNINEVVYYVQQAQCTSTVDGGDVTKLILRLPKLLTASFGVWPTPRALGSGTGSSTGVQ